MISDNKKFFSTKSSSLILISRRGHNFQLILINLISIFAVLMSRKHNKGQAKTTPAPKNNKLYNYILLSAFALFIILFTTSKLTNEDDYFWHFATGRYIVETGSIPSNDVFSFSSAGTRWLVTEWGWDVMTFIIFKYLGYAGISILCTLTFLIMFFVYYVLLRRFDVSETVIIFFFILFQSRWDHLLESRN